MDEAEAVEGAILTRIHRLRERNPSLVQAKKEGMIEKEGGLACEVCIFDFEGVYGELGRSVAECHHTKPLSEFESEEKTRLDDLAIACANCHRMIHRGRPWLSIEELREVLKNRRPMA